MPHDDGDIKGPKESKPALPLNVLSTPDTDKKSEDALAAAIKTLSGLDDRTPKSMITSTLSDRVHFGDDHICGPGCNHEDHDDHHHEDDFDPKDHNNGLLNRVLPESITVKLPNTLIKRLPEASALRRLADINLNNNFTRSSVLATIAIGLNQINPGSIEAVTATGIGALIIANDATEELMHGVHNTKAKLGIKAGALTLALSAAHITTEGGIAVMAHFQEAAARSAELVANAGVQVADRLNEYTGYAMTMTDINVLLHGPLLGGAIGMAGSLAISKPHIRKVTFAAMSATTALYGAHLAIGDTG